MLTLTLDHNRSLRRFFTASLRRRDGLPAGWGRPAFNICMRIDGERVSPPADRRPL